MLTRRHLLDDERPARGGILDNDDLFDLIEAMFGAELVRGDLERRDARLSSRHRTRKPRFVHRVRLGGATDAMDQATSPDRCLHGAWIAEPQRRHLRGKEFRFLLMMRSPPVCAPEDSVETASNGDAAST